MDKIYEHISINKGYCVNIGTSDGNDICDALFSNGYDGLCVEPINVVKAKEYVDKLPGKVALVTDFAKPDNIHDILKSCPKDMDMLKIDIDGYDLELMRKIFEHGYVPKVLVMEINETIPPPVLFEIPFIEEWRFHSEHVFGCSIQSVQNVMSSHGYKIIDLCDEFQRNNILAVKSDEVTGTEGIELWEKLYKNDDNKYLCFPWNIDVRNWLADPSMCETDLKRLFLNKKYGTNLHTSLHEEPCVSAEYKEFVLQLLGRDDISTVVDVGTWNKAGFSKIVIDHVLNTGDQIGLYKIESASRYYNELLSIWKTNYGEVLKDFTLLSHARILSNKEYSPPSGHIESKIYETFHFWTMQARQCNLPRADFAFVHMYPDWIPEAVSVLEKSGVKYVSMMTYMKKSMKKELVGWVNIYADDEFVVLQRK